VLWLNEAMSHFAEELGGRTFLPIDTTTFCTYVNGDLINASKYLAATGDHPLVDTSGIGGLEERGAGWLFVRYLIDRFAANTTLAAQNAFTQSLVQTSVTSTNNVTQATGTPFTTTETEWALAQWVSDLTGFTAPAPLKYRTWAFRSAYPTLSARCPNLGIPAGFPLAAGQSPGASLRISGVMRAGSGAAYERALQAPGAAGYTLLFSDSTGAQLRSTVRPRLNVVRVR
jgi:hypothetical protein